MVTSKQTWKDRFMVLVCLENRVKSDHYMSSLNMDSYVIGEHIEPIMDIISKHLTKTEMVQIRKKVANVWSLE